MNSRVNKMKTSDVLKQKRSKAVLNDTVLLLSKANGDNEARLKIIFSVMAYFFGQKMVEEDVAFSWEFTRRLYFLDDLIAQDPSFKTDLKKIKKETSPRKGFTLSDTERRLAFAGMIVFRHIEQQKLLNILRQQIQLKTR